MINEWCEILDLDPPRIEDAKDQADANTYSLFLVALLEQGAPMTLAQVAARFEKAGVATAERALASLRRCQPGRAPAYRDGDLYHLDPHDAELDFWLFRLGLRPPKVARLRLVPPDPEPIPDLDVRLTPQELEEGWKGLTLSGSWSSQRVAVAVLDALGGPTAPEEVIAAASRWARSHSLRVNHPYFKRAGGAVVVLDDGR